MRKLLTGLFALLFVLMSCTNSSKYQDSYVIEVDGKKGLIDSLGNVIVQPRFIDITPILKDGYATAIIDTLIAQKTDTTILGLVNKTIIKVKYGYINSSGKFLFPEPSFAEIDVPDSSSFNFILSDFCENRSFSNGLAVVENDASLFGYRNTRGDTVIPCKYSDAKLFCEKRAVVRKPFELDSINHSVKPGSNRYGFIDDKGNEVSKFNYSLLNNLRRGRTIGVIAYTSYNDEGYEIDGIIDKDSNGNIQLDKSKKTKIEGDGSPEFGWSLYLLDSNGNIIKQLGMVYSYSNFSNDDIAVAIPNRLGEFFGLGYGFIDLDGNDLKPLAGLTETEIDSLSQLELVRAALSEDITLYDATRFTNGYAAVKLGDEAWVYIDKHLIVYGKEDEEIFEDAGPFSNGLAAVKKNGKWGYIDTNFNFIIPCQYDSCFQAGRNLAKIYQSPNNPKIISYINRNNDIVWQNTEYNEISLSRADNSKPKSDWGKWNDIEYEVDSSSYFELFILLGIIIAIGIILLIFYKKRNGKKENSLSLSVTKTQITTPFLVDSAEPQKGQNPIETSSSSIRSDAPQVNIRNQSASPTNNSSKKSNTISSSQSDRTISKQIIPDKVSPSVINPSKSLSQEKLILFFDTETTGIPQNYNAPSSDTNNWPRLVQISWIITDERGRIKETKDFIIKPKGFTIPTNASNVHNITTERAIKEGYDLEYVISLFIKALDKCSFIVGHNVSFDKKIVGAELIRLGKRDILIGKRSICTMQASTDFCAIPGYYGYKYPKLQELYIKLFGKKFSDAHNSMADITATVECYFELKRRKLL